MMKSGGLGIITRFSSNVLYWENGCGFMLRRGKLLWRLVIDTIYDRLRGGSCSKEVARPFGVGVWKYIRRRWETCSKFIKYEVDDGSKVSFWHDMSFFINIILNFCSSFFS